MKRSVLGVVLGAAIAEVIWYVFQRFPSLFYLVPLQYGGTFLADQLLPPIMGGFVAGIIPGRRGWVHGAMAGLIFQTVGAAIVAHRFARELPGHLMWPAIRLVLFSVWFWTTLSWLTLLCILGGCISDAFRDKFQHYAKFAKSV